MTCENQSNHLWILTRALDDKFCKCANFVQAIFMILSFKKL